jgi:hypothetical protein
MPPFTYGNVKYLLHYLDTHSYTPKATYDVKFMSSYVKHPAISYAIGPIEPCILEMTVQGSLNIRAISESEGTYIKSIFWANNDSNISIDFDSRSIHITAKSLVSSKYAVISCQNRR